MDPVSIEAIQAYLDQYFFTLDELAQETRVHANRIRELIDRGCIPQHSYEIENAITFKNNLGATTLPHTCKQYYAPSLVNWVKRAQTLAQGLPLSEVAERMREAFTAEFRSALKQLDGTHEAWPQCFTAEGEFCDAALATVIDNCWRDMMKGAYGICLREITALSMVRKGIALSQITRITNNFTKPQLNDEERQTLIDAVELYNTVVMPFAPHEQSASSRGQQINRAIQQYQLNFYSENSKAVA